MSMITPIMMLGKDAVFDYQDTSIQELEDFKTDPSKGKSGFTNFDEYLEDLEEKYFFNEAKSNVIDDGEFAEIESFDESISKQVKTALHDAGLLNDYGYINFNQMSYDKIVEVINGFDDFSDDQKNTLVEMIENIRDYKASDFEMFSKQMFEFNSTDSNLSAYNITEAESETIWNQLNAQGVLDDYGVLLLDVNSDELEAAIANLTDFTEDQQKRVMVLLNQFPELSYSSYVAEVGANKIPLTKQEYDYVKIISAMEWSMISTTVNRTFKQTKKLHAKRKSDRKKEDMENMRFMEQQSAVYRAKLREMLKPKRKR